MTSPKEENTMNVKTTPWRKPVGDCGGISELVRLRYIEKETDTDFFVDVKLHAYREVGTSLECAIEVLYYDLVKVDGVYKRNVFNIQFLNWSY